MSKFDQRTRNITLSQNEKNKTSANAKIRSFKLEVQPGAGHLFRINLVKGSTLS